MKRLLALAVSGVVLSGCGVVGGLFGVSEVATNAEAAKAWCKSATSDYVGVEVAWETLDASNVKASDGSPGGAWDWVAGGVATWTKDGKPHKAAVTCGFGEDGLIDDPLISEIPVSG